MTTTPAEPPVQVFCSRSYYADVYQRYAFVFRVCETSTRFTVYTDSPETYTPGRTYLLTLTRAYPSPTLPAPAGMDRSEGDT